jgi:hypothetical protein
MPNKKPAWNRWQPQRRTTRRYIPWDRTLYNRRCENLKCLLPASCWFLSWFILRPWRLGLLVSLLVFFLWRYSPNLSLGLPPWNSPLHFGFLDLRQSVGLLGRVISSSKASTYIQTQKNAHTYTNTEHPCSEWDSKPWSRLPSERRQCMR